MYNQLTTFCQLWLNFDKCESECNVILFPFAEAIILHYVLFKAKSKGTNVIHNLRCSFMKKSPFYVTGNLVIVMQFISQSVPKTSQNPRHAKAQGHVESLKLYSIL